MPVEVQIMEVITLVLTQRSPDVMSSNLSYPHAMAWEFA